MKTVVHLHLNHNQFPQYLAYLRECEATRKSEHAQLNQKLDNIGHQLEGLGAIVVELRNLQQLNERMEKIMAKIDEQITGLKQDFDAFGVALDTEIVQIKDKIQSLEDKLNQENPTLAALAADIKAQTEKVQGIIVDSPLVPSVS